MLVIHRQRHRIPDRPPQPEHRPFILPSAECSRLATHSHHSPIASHIAACRRSRPPSARLIPHSRCCTVGCPTSAISCLGASPTPAVGAPGCRRHAGVRETFTTRDQKASHNKGSPQVSSYLETCRDRYSSWSPKGGDSGPTNFDTGSCYRIYGGSRRPARPSTPGRPKACPMVSNLSFAHLSSMLCLGLAI